MELRINGGTVIIDSWRYDQVKGYSWYVASGYATADITEGGERRRLLMHRLIARAPEGLEVDHENRNRLDNREENLRIATSSQNRSNRGILPTNTTGYKGVSRRRGKFRATIQVNKKAIELGFYACPCGAAKAYNAAAVKYFNEFASLNTVEDCELCK